MCGIVIAIIFICGVIATKVFDYACGEKGWWEKEAEENGMTVELYMDKLKLEKQNAEYELLRLKRKEDARSRREKWDDYQAEQFEKEKEKVAGYEQVVKLYGAYVAILLEKLGATQDKPVNISKADATDGMSRIEARAMPSEDGWCLYCEVVKD